MAKPMPRGVREVARLLLGCAAATVLACGGDPGDDAAAIPTALAAERVGAVLAEGDALDRVAELGALLPRIPPEALPDVLAAFERSKLDGLDPEYVLLATWWARFDPVAALDWGIANPRATSYAVITAACRTWAHAAPQTAWAHTAQLDPPTAELVRAAVLAGWEESDPSGAVEHVGSIAILAERQKAADVLARRRVLSLGGEGAIRWLESLPPGPFRSELEARVASEVAAADPAALLAWVEPRIANARRPTGLPRRIGTRWVRRDPVAAMAWLASLPAGRDRDDGVMESFRDWRSVDRTAATAWIASRELEPWLEPAFALYADQIAPERPEEALAFVARLRDEILRNRFTTMIARKWLRRDFAAADAWVKQAALPEDVRRRVYMLGGEGDERGAASRPPGPRAG